MGHEGFGDGCDGLLHCQCIVCAKEFTTPPFEGAVVCEDCYKNRRGDYKYRMLKQVESDIYMSLQNHIPEYLTDVAFEDLYGDIKDDVMRLYNALVGVSDA